MLDNKDIIKKICPVGACFVKKDIPWCHFDIAGSAWGDKNLPYQNKGLATGEIIRLVVDLLDI